MLAVEAIKIQKKKNDDSYSTASKSAASSAERFWKTRREAYDLERELNDYKDNLVDELSKKRYGKTYSELEDEARNERQQWADLDNRLSKKSISFNDYQKEYAALYEKSAYKKMNDIEDTVYDDDYQDDTIKRINDQIGRKMDEANKAAMSFVTDFVDRNGSLNVDKLVSGMNEDDEETVRDMIYNSDVYNNFSVDYSPDGYVIRKQ